MEQYIPKDALVAEIDKEIKCIYAGREYVGIPLDEENRVYGLQIAKGIINTLEVKEVDTEQLDKLLNWWKEVTSDYSAYKVKEVEDKPVSEDLEEAANDYGIRQGAELKPFAIKFFKAGAKWQKEQDQSTIELAEDHAMFAGMEKMKEQMIAKAIDAELYSDGMLTPIIKVNDKEKISDIKFGDEVKVIVIKND